MDSSGPSRSPLARLVLFMVCLAIAGSIAAGAHYYAVDLPVQNTVQAPENSDWKCSDCPNVCRWSGVLAPTCLKLCLGNCVK